MDDERGSHATARRLFRSATSLLLYVHMACMESARLFPTHVAVFLRSLARLLQREPAEMVPAAATGHLRRFSHTSSLTHALSFSLYDLRNARAAECACVWRLARDI